MVDWFNLAANSLWILGCALALATLSYARWEASTKGEKLRSQLNSHHFQVPLNLAGALFCLGLAGTSDAVWEIVVWLILAVLFCVQIGVEVYQTRRGESE